jgi:hypothetical protein
MAGQAPRCARNGWVGNGRLPRVALSESGNPGLSSATPLVLWGCVALREDLESGDLLLARLNPALKRRAILSGLFGTEQRPDLNFQDEC